MTQASYTSDQTILSAWQQGLSETSKDTAFKQALLQQQGELLPCFVDHYQSLKALPRSMRRALQRQWRRSLAGVALLLVLGQALHCQPLSTSVEAVRWCEPLWLPTMTPQPVAIALKAVAQTELCCPQAVHKR